MNSSLPSTIAILERLVGFDSISAKPTREIVQYICDYLSDHGFEAELSYDEDGSRANIFATIGPLIDGGVARNATAGWCNFNWEFRPMPGEDGDQTTAEITDYTLYELLPAMKAVHADCAINIVSEAPVPALDDTNASLAAEFVSQITGLNNRDVVSFGTDAGYFSNAGLSAVVFGPGSIARAHKPDEYIETNELEQGLDFLAKLAHKLSV